MRLPGLVRQVHAGLAQLDDEIVQGLVENAAAVAARLALGVAFLVVAFLGVRLVLRAVRGTVERRGRTEFANLAATVVGVALWFGVALAFLSIVGLEDIAASLGTATGFVALGVSYALSGMLADTVAGVYLIRDPDFDVGDRVTVDETTGTVEAVDLRKSRLRLDDGDLVVMANEDVEKQWRKEVGGDGEAGDGDAGDGEAGDGDVAAADADDAPADDTPADDT